MMNEVRLWLNRINLYYSKSSGNRLTFTPPLHELTGEPPAVDEEYGCHAHGKVQMGDVTCEKRGESDEARERKGKRRRK